MGHSKRDLFTKKIAERLELGSHLSESRWQLLHHRDRLITDLICGEPRLPMTMVRAIPNPGYCRDAPATCR